MCQLVTPVEVAWGTSNEGLSAAMDIVFLMSIVINFNTGYRTGVQYITDRTMIAQYYIRGW